MAEVPYRLTRVGTVMVPDPDRAEEAEGVLNPASGYGPDGRLYLLPRVVAQGNYSRVGLAEVLLDEGVPVSVERRGVVLEPDEAWEHGADHGGVEDPRVTWVPDLGVHIMTYVAYRPDGPAAGAGELGGPALVATTGSGALRVRARPAARLQPVPQQGRRVLPGAGARAGRGTLLGDAAPADVGPGLDPRGRGRRPAGRPGRSATGHLDLLRSRGRGREGRLATRALVRPPARRALAARVRGHQDRRWATAAPGPRGLAVAASRRVGGDRARASGCSSVWSTPPER